MSAKKPSFTFLGRNLEGKDFSEYLHRKGYLRMAQVSYVLEELYPCWFCSGYGFNPYDANNPCPSCDSAGFLFPGEKLIVDTAATCRDGGVLTVSQHRYPFRSWEGSIPRARFGTSCGFAYGPKCLELALRDAVRSGRSPADGFLRILPSGSILFASPVVWPKDWARRPAPSEGGDGMIVSKGYWEYETRTGEPT